MRNYQIQVIKFLTSLIFLFFLSIILLGGCYSKKNYSENNLITNKDVGNFFSSVRAVNGQAKSHYKLAIFLQERKRHKMAIDEFSKAIQSDPTMIEAYSAMGISYDKLRDYERAIYCYKFALKIYPNLDSVHNNLGVSYFYQGNLELAIRAFKDAIALNFKNKRYHNNLGLAYAKKGLFSQAFDEFVLGTDKARAHVNMGKIYYGLGQYEKAKVHFTEGRNKDFSSLESKNRMNKDEIFTNNTGKGRLFTCDQSKDSIDYNEKNSITSELKSKTDFDIEKLKQLQFSKIGNRKRPGEREVFSISKGNLPQAPDCLSTHAGMTQNNYSIIEISNGNGVRKMAKRVGDYLKIKGAKVTRITNAPHFNFAETKIYYQDTYLHEAYKIAKEIPGFQNMEKSSNLSLNNIHVKVLIGKDLIFYDNYFFSQNIQANSCIRPKGSSRN
jgi:Flp pilus assembly protein TadD